MTKCEKVVCTVCGAPGQNIGGGWWIKLCPKHHAEEIAKSANDKKKDDDDIYADYDFPCGY